MTDDQFWRITIGAALLGGAPFLKQALLSLKERWRRRRAQKTAAATQKRSY